MNGLVGVEKSPSEIATLLSKVKTLHALLKKVVLRNVKLQGAIFIFKEGNIHCPDPHFNARGGGRGM